MQDYVEYPHPEVIKEPLSHVKTETAQCYNQIQWHQDFQTLQAVLILNGISGCNG